VKWKWKILFTLLSKVLYNSILNKFFFAKETTHKFYSFCNSD
jgi:hypothetical protein